MTDATPEDLAEQAAEALPEPYPGQSPGPSDEGLPLEADPADAAEQAAVVDLDDDEPR